MKLASKALVLVMIMGFYVGGITFGRPEPDYSPSQEARAALNPETIFHPDEFAYVGRAFRMLQTGDWDPHYYHNPSLNIYTDIGLFWLGDAADYPYNAELGIREIAPFQLYVMARYGSALFMLLTVALTWAAGRVSFGKTAANTAAGLVALSPLIVEHAHFATPNAQTTMLYTASLLAALTIMTDRIPARIPAWLFFGIAGALVGLTAVARYNAVIVGSVTALAFAVAWWRDRRRWRAVLVGGAMIPAAAIAGMPALVLVPDAVERQIRGILQWYGESGGGPGFSAEKGLPSIMAHWSYLAIMAVGAGGMLSAAGGLALALRTGRTGTSNTARHPDALVAGALLVNMVIYTGAALRGSRLQANLLFPLIIPLALLAGYFVTRLRTAFPTRQRVITLWVVVVIAWPAIGSALLFYRIATPDNRLDAQAWIESNVAHGTRVHMLGAYNVPLDPMHYTTSQSYAREATAAFLRETDAQIIVYSDAYPHIVFRDADYLPAQTARETEIITALETEWIQIAAFERWPWLFEDLNPDDVSYWFQMGISIYCNPADCPLPLSE